MKNTLVSYAIITTTCVGALEYILFKKATVASAFVLPLVLSSETLGSQIRVISKTRSATYVEFIGVGVAEALVSYMVDNDMTKSIVLGGAAGLAYYLTEYKMKEYNAASEHHLYSKMN